MDEFDWIARLRPLADSPEALGLTDDAAVIPSRLGFDLIVSKDALVEGVHFLPGTPGDLVARKALRVNLSDLAAKGAEPYGYFLAIAWPADAPAAAHEAFIAGLAKEQEEFHLKLFGGDTVSTLGPLSVSVTVLGWTPQGRAILRGGAKAEDLIFVSGTIGDGALGLLAARGELQSPALAARYVLPQPRLDLREVLRAYVHAAADVSDGLLADAGRIGQASGLGVEIVLERMPLSPEAALWVSRQPDRLAALAHLASGGDDYQLVCAAPAVASRSLEVAGFACVGRMTAGEGITVLHEGQAVPAARTGYRHGNPA